MTSILRRLFGKQEESAPMRDVAALAAPLAVPAIQIVGLGTPSLSHLGGSPGLPPGVPWPERDGARLGFLARLSLAELQSSLQVDWLPKSGALLFFYDMERQPWGYDPKDRGSFAVLLVPDLPEPMPQRGGGPECEPSSLPHRSECQLASNGVYCGDAGANRYPRALQLASRAANWRLLLQLDTDDDLGVMWGDGGTIYYWVEEHKARSGDFSDSWLVLQCT